jgi:tetratricopeptide (TPR) repeat protein
MHDMRALTLAGGVAAMVWAGLARAEQACPTAGSAGRNRELASDAFDAAEAAYAAGDSQEALAQFRCSYELVPHAATLYNLGVVADATGDPTLARDYYREYLRVFPESEGRAEIEARLRRVEERLAAVGGATEQESGTAQAPTLAPAPAPAQSGRSPMTTGRVMAFVTLALGIAVAGTGGALYAIAYARNATFQDELGQGELGAPELEVLADRGRALEISGWALMGTGLAALATSVVLFAVVPARRSAAGSNATLAPFVGGDGGIGMALSGRF